MPIIQENPTYFNDKSAAAVALNASSIGGSFRSTSEDHKRRNSASGATRKLSVSSSCDDDGAAVQEMETFLSSYESGNSYCAPETKIIRNRSYRSEKSKENQYPKFSYASLRRKGKNEGSSIEQSPSSSSSSSGIGSLGRFSQLLFKKSKSKCSVGSESHASSTVESSGIGSPTVCTPDSSLSIYTNSLDGDSHSSTNSNQISPKLFGNREDIMDDNRFCSTYTFDDCGIFAANMYYNVGESSVFTIYHPNETKNSKNANNSMRAIGSNGQSRDDEFEDCVQPYYNNSSFSTFSNPKRCSVASAASTTTSSIVPVNIKKSGASSSTATASILQDRDGYLKPNEPTCNLRNAKNPYLNDSVIASFKNNRNGASTTSGQVQHVQVDVHTPKDPSSGGSRLAYHFDSASSTTSQATTLVAGSGRSNGGFNFPISDDGDDSVIYGDDNGHQNRRTNGGTPIYMNKAYFGSNSMGSSSGSSSGYSQSHKNLLSKVITSGKSPSTAFVSDCEPYCSLCSSSIMGSPRMQSRMDVVIVKCKECFFSREVESHIRGFFDKLMTEDKQKMDVTLKSYDLKDLDHPTDRTVVHCAKVQIVIISHHFLQRLKDEAARKPRLSPVNRVFKSKNVISVLWAVTAQEIQDGYEAVLPRFREWYSVELRSTNKYDPEFCKKFTEQVVRIYNVELSNSSSFSVFPKKVTREQPKIVIVLKKPVSQDDEVRVELKTQRQSFIVSDLKMENPHTAMLRVPENLSPDREAIVDVSVFINKNKIGGSRIKSELNLRRVDDDEVDRMGRILPPFTGWLDKHIANTLLKHYKECTDYTTDPELELMNGIIIVKADILPTIMHFAAYYGLHETAFIVLEEADGLTQCTIKNELEETPTQIAFDRGHDHVGQMLKEYHEISNSYTAFRFIKDIIEKDTEDFKSETSCGKNLNDYEECTNDTGSAFSKPVEENGNYYEEEQHQPERSTPPSVSSEIGVSDTNRSGEETDVVVKQPPTPTARRKNRAGEYINVRKPEENPEKVQTREKRVGRSPEILMKRKSIFPPNYDIPRNMNEDYKVPPPEIRPVQKVQDGPVLITKNPGRPKVTSSGYLIIDTTEVDKEARTKTEETNDSPNSSSHTVEKCEPGEVFPSRKQSVDVGVSSHNHISENGTCNGQGSNDVQLDIADKQLIDLLNDFKNKTIDIQMLEKLFDQWKQRPDVIKSMEDRMKAVERLREDYQKLTQQKGSKKTFSMDRFKSYWKRKRSNAAGTLEFMHPNQESKTGQTLPLPSPTSLSFTGPTIPPQPQQMLNASSSTLPRISSTQPPSNYDFRASESSYRTSIDSRFSDSSVESDKAGSSHSSGASSGNTRVSKPPAPQLPLEYRNPLCQRLVPDNVSLTPSIESPLDLQETDPNSKSSGPKIAYEIPPPPRPVKPGRLNAPSFDDTKPSPKQLRKPPVIIEEEPIPILPSPSLKRKPPAIPSKPKSALNDEQISPPPLPPPRSNNSPNMFNYIDYQARQDGGDRDRSSPVKQTYENDVMKT